MQNDSHIPLQPDRDTELIFPHFALLKASAGSGKTHALAKRFVQFLLSDRIPHNGLNNLLAITFSNNAAREMKERILQWLKEVALEKPQAMDDIAGVVSLDRGALGGRAALLLDEILSDYGDFQVRTIDSFMATVLKASAIDFGYDPQFEIVMTMDPLAKYAFNLFLRRVRQGTAEGRFMEEMVDLLMENRPATASFLWDPSTEILGQVMGIYRKLSGRTETICIDDASPEMEEVRKMLRQAVGEMEKLITSSDLQRSRNSSYESIHEAVKTGRFADLLGKGMKNLPVTKPREARDKAAYERIAVRWDEIRIMVDNYHRVYAACYYYPYIRVYQNFVRLLEKVKKREGQVFIEDVNRMLAEYLRSEIVPDIYFRIGDVIFHYLIDEFQDTSPIQWANLLPLLENSCAQGGSVFVVGDAKQAIYGFREADYRIMKGCEKVSPFPSACLQVRELERNFRSREAVVSFGKKVFQEIVPSDPKYCYAAGQSGLLDYTQSALHEDTPGYAGYWLLERNDLDPPEKAKIHELLEELALRGYRYGDIGILTLRNDDVVAVSTWLNERDIPFLSYSSLDVRRRKVTGEVLALLTFLNAPLDDLAFATFVLGDIFGRALLRRGDDGFMEEFRDLCLKKRQTKRPLYKLFQEQFPHPWADYFEDLFNLSGYLPPYDLTVSVLKHFDVFGTFEGEEEASFAKILEVVSDFEGMGRNSLNDFVTFAQGDEEADWDLEIPQSSNAVKVMTVHKAKGLGFPVTILLLYGERNKGFGPILNSDGTQVRLLKVTKSMTPASEELAEIYAREELAARVNDLNTLYVGLSRAGRELYLIGVKGERDTFPFDLLPSGQHTSLGEKRATVDKPGETGDLMSGYHSPRSVVLAEPSPEGIIMAEEEKRRGRFMHRIFAHLPSEEFDLGEPDELIERAGKEEVIDYDLEETRRTVVGLLKDPRIASYLSGEGWEHIGVEQEYCDGAGQLFRMDRVVVGKDEAVVLDYKTGTEKGDQEKHVRQMKNYIKILADIYPDKAIKGLLVYMDREEVTEVGMS